jgi:5'-3' exonuclease
MSRMLIVDGMSVLKTTAGGTAFLTNGFAYNFFTQLKATINRFEDIKGVIVCWEGGDDYRTRIYSEYKAHRKRPAEAPANNEIRDQRKIVQKLLHLLGVDQVHAEGYEGDDMGAWLVQNLNVPMVLYSNDQDWLQLVRPGVSIYQKSAMSEGKKNSRVEITRDKFTHYTGFPSPEEFLTCKCLMGDDGDIGKGSGIAGVGIATVKAWAINAPISASRSTAIKEFMETEKYARNRLLIDLISPKLELQPIWNKGEPDYDASLAYLTELKWHSVTGQFPKWWATFEGSRL